MITTYVPATDESPKEWMRRDLNEAYHIIGVLIVKLGGRVEITDFDMLQSRKGVWYAMRDDKAFSTILQASALPSPSSEPFQGA